MSSSIPTEITLVNLPENVLIEVFNRLDAQDLVRIRSLCQALRALCNEQYFYSRNKQRFGVPVADLQEMPQDRLLQPAPPAIGLQQQLFLKYSSCRNSMADTTTSGGCWTNDDRYYDRRPYRGSISPEVLFLESVCWLLNTTIFKGVRPGTYKLLWRVHAQSASGIQALTMKVKLNSCRDLEGNHIDIANAFEDVESTVDSKADIDESVDTVDPHHNESTHNDDAYNSGSDDGDGAHSNSPKHFPGPVDEHNQRCLYESSVAIGVIKQDPSANGWTVVDGGTFTVPAGRVFDVTAEMGRISDYWKHAMAWDVVWLLDMSNQDTASSQTPISLKSLAHQAMQQGYQGPALVRPNQRAASLHDGSVGGGAYGDDVAPAPNNNSGNRSLLDAINHAFQKVFSCQ